MIKFSLMMCLLLTQYTMAANLPSYRIKVGKCGYNRNYFENLTLSISNNTISSDLFVKKRITDGFKAHLELDLRRPKVNNYQNLFAHDMNVCSMIGSLRSNLVKNWFNVFAKYGNYNIKCPVDVGRYWMKGFQLDQTLMPIYLYAGHYRIHAYGYYGRYQSKSEVYVLDCTLNAVLH